LQRQNLNGLRHAYLLPHHELRKYRLHLLEARRDFMPLFGAGVGDHEEMRGTGLQPFRFAGMKRQTREQGNAS